MSLLRLGFLALLGCAPVFATPCPTAALSVYEGFGATGCTVGLFTFHDFNFILGAPSIGSPVALTAVDINVSPVTTPTEFGLNYASGGFSVATGQKITYLLTYTIDPPPPIIWGFDLSFDADPPVFPGIATITSLECPGAPFTGPTCPSPTVTNTVSDNGTSASHLHTDIQQIPGATNILGDRTTIVLDATAGGSAEFLNFTESVVTPEPGTLVLTALASALLWNRRRRPR
jgi:hypothetical protein